MDFSALNGKSCLVPPRLKDHYGSEIREIVRDCLDVNSDLVFDGGHRTIVYLNSQWMRCYVQELYKIKPDKIRAWMKERFLPLAKELLAVDDYWRVEVQFPSGTQSLKI